MLPAMTFPVAVNRSPACGPLSGPRSCLKHTHRRALDVAGLSQFEASSTTPEQLPCPDEEE